MDRRTHHQKLDFGLDDSKTTSKHSFDSLAIAVTICAANRVASHARLPGNLSYRESFFL